MREKDKFFFLGMANGIAIPFLEYAIINNELDVTSRFANAVLIGGEIWHYIFLFLVLFNSLVLYLRKLRERINPNSRIIFMITGVAFGFSSIAILSATIHYFG